MCWYNIAKSDSYNNILKFGTPYVVCSVYMHVCIHTVLPFAKIVCPVCVLLKMILLVVHTAKIMLGKTTLGKELL